MEEQLITFETAEIAKEKGFELNVKYNYYNCPSFYEMKYGSGKYWADELGTEEVAERNQWLTDFKPNRIHTKFSAPTQSLLQKWLREKHHLNLEIYACTAHIDAFEKICTWQTALGWSKNQDILSDEKTYEEALEKGLQEALKLIK